MYQINNFVHIKIIIEWKISVTFPHAQPKVFCSLNETESTHLTVMLLAVILDKN